MSIRASSSCCFAYEDKRFSTHHGVDPLALLRAAFQFVTQRPHRLGRLDADHAGGAAAGAARASQLRRQAASDRARARARARAEQGRNSLAISDTCALWRQSGRHPRGLACLFRQGAAQALARRSGAAGGAAAIAGSAPARPLRQGRARAARDRVLDRVAAAGACRATRSRAPRPSRCRMRASRCRCWRRMPPTTSSPQEPDDPRAPAHHRRAFADEHCEELARERARAHRSADLGRHPRGRQCDRRGARARRLRRLSSMRAAPARST